MELYEESNDGQLVSYDTSVPTQTEQPTYSSDFIKGAAEGATKFIDTAGQFSSGAQKGLVDMLDLVGGYSNQEASDMKAAIDLEGGMPQTILDKTLNFAGQLAGPDILMGGVASELKGLGIATKNLGALDKLGVMLESLPGGERLLPALYSASEKAQRIFPTGAKIVDSLRKLPETVASFGASGFSEKAKDFVKTAPEVLFESARPWQEVYKDMAKVFSERVKSVGSKIESYEKILKENLNIPAISKMEVSDALASVASKIPQEASRFKNRILKLAEELNIKGSSNVGDQSEYLSMWDLRDLKDRLEATTAFSNLKRVGANAMTKVERDSIKAFAVLKDFEKKALEKTRDFAKGFGGAEEALLTDYIESSGKLDEAIGAFSEFEGGLKDYANLKQFQRDIGAIKGAESKVFAKNFVKAFKSNEETAFDAFKSFLPENLFKEGASKVINMSDDAFETSLELGAGLRRGLVDAGKSVLAKTAVAPFAPKPAYATTVAADVTKGVGKVLTSPLRLASKPGAISVGLNNLLPPSEQQ